MVRMELMVHKAHEAHKVHREYKVSLERMVSPDTHGLNMQTLPPVVCLTFLMAKII
jgi:hypothetical protein